MSNKSQLDAVEPTGIHSEKGLRRSLKDTLEDRNRLAIASGSILTRSHHRAYPVVPGQADKYVGLED